MAQSLQICHKLAAHIPEDEDLALDLSELLIAYCLAQNIRARTSFQVSSNPEYLLRQPNIDHTPISARVARSPCQTTSRRANKCSVYGQSKDPVSIPSQARSSNQPSSKINQIQNRTPSMTLTPEARPEASIRNIKSPHNELANNSASISMSWACSRVYLGCARLSTRACC